MAGRRSLWGRRRCGTELKKHHHACGDEHQPEQRGGDVGSNFHVFRVLSGDYSLGVASATVLIAANPFSNWSPIILSMFMNRHMALAMKWFLPVIVHVTTV